MCVLLLAACSQPGNVDSAGYVFPGQAALQVCAPSCCVHSSLNNDNVFLLF